MRSLPSDPEGGRVALTPDAIAELAALTEQHISDLAELGVRVIGDTDWLMPPEPAGEAPRVDRRGATLSTRSAALGTAGVVQRALRDRRFALEDPTAEHHEVAMVDDVHATLARGVAGGAQPDGTFRVTRPWHDWAARWALHLLGRGTGDVDSWVESHAADQSTALQQWLADGGRADRVTVADADAGADAPVLDWEEALVLSDLVALGREQGWDDETWARYVVRGVVATMLAEDVDDPSRGLPWELFTASAARAEIARLLALLPEPAHPAIEALLPEADESRQTTRQRISPRVAARAALGAIAAADEPGIPSDPTN